MLFSLNVHIVETGVGTQGHLPPMRLSRVTMLKVSFNCLKVKEKGKHAELHKIPYQKGESRRVM